MESKGISEALKAGLRQPKSINQQGLLKLSEAFRKLSEAEKKDDNNKDEAGS